MPRTPDRRPGVQLEDDSIQFEDRGAHTGVVGSIYRLGDKLYFQDDTGVYDLRETPSTAATLCRLILTTWGGVVYDTAGEIVRKEND